MKKNIYILSILFLAIIHLLDSEIFASDILTYSLCKNNVSKAIVSSYNDSYSINIKLTPSATKEFSELTEKNIGMRLEIKFKDRVIVSAIIKAQIPSGNIQVKAKSKKEANTLVKDILNYDPNHPCGVLTQ